MPFLVTTGNLADRSTSSSATNDVTIYLSRPSPDVVGTIHGAEVLLLISHLCPLGPACLIRFRSVF